MPTGFGGPGSASQYKSNTIYTNSNTTTQQICPANPNRYALMISSSGANVNFGINPKNVSSLNGEIQFGLQYYTIILTYRDLGPYIQNAFYSATNSGAANTYVTEIVYVPSG